MKQNFYIEKKAFSPNGPILKEAVAGFEKPKQEGSHPFKKNKIAAAIPTALHIGRGSQHIGRDGPPGRARSPGRTSGMSVLPQRSLSLLKGKSIKSINYNHFIHTNIQSFYTY